MATIKKIPVLQAILLELLRPGRENWIKQLEQDFAVEQQMSSPLNATMLRELNQTLTQIQSGDSTSLSLEQQTLLAFISRVEIGLDNYVLAPSQSEHLLTDSTRRSFSSLWRPQGNFLAADELRRLHRVYTALEHVKIMDAEGRIRQIDEAAELQAELDDALITKDRNLMLQFLEQAESYIEASRSSLLTGPIQRTELVGKLLRFEIIFEALENFLNLLNHPETLRGQMLRSSLNYFTWGEDSVVKILKEELIGFKTELEQRLDGRYMSGRTRERNFEFFFRKNARLTALVLVLSGRGEYAAARPFFEILEPSLEPWEKQHLAFLQQGPAGLAHDWLMELLHSMSSMNANSSDYAPYSREVNAYNVKKWGSLFNKAQAHRAGLETFSYWEFQKELVRRYGNLNQLNAEQLSLVGQAIDLSLLARQEANAENILLLYSLYESSIAHSPKQELIRFHLLLMIYEAYPTKETTFHAFLFMLVHGDTRVYEVEEFLKSLCEDKSLIPRVSLKIWATHIWKKIHPNPIPHGAGSGIQEPIYFAVGAIPEGPMRPRRFREIELRRRLEVEQGIADVIDIEEAKIRLKKKRSLGKGPRNPRGPSGRR